VRTHVPNSWTHTYTRTRTVRTLFLSFLPLFTSFLDGYFTVSLSFLRDFLLQFLSSRASPSLSRAIKYIFSWEISSLSLSVSSRFSSFFNRRISSSPLQISMNMCFSLYLNLAAVPFSLSILDAVSSSSPKSISFLLSPRPCFRTFLVSFCFPATFLSDLSTITTSSYVSSTVIGQRG